MPTLGKDTLLIKLKAKKDGYMKGVETGLKKAGVVLLGASLKQVPVDTGFLRRSGDIITTGSLLTTKVFVGYKANYAVMVHENVEMAGAGLPRKPPHKGHYWDPQGQAKAKFLEDPFKELLPKMKQIIAQEVKKGNDAS